LSARVDGTLVLRTWLLENARDPVRWVVTAPLQGRARIDRQPAAALLDVPSEHAQVTARATASLAGGAEPDRLWALQALADAGETRAVPAVAALLLGPAASEGVRTLAAATLARLGGEAAVAPLGQSLRAAGPTGLRTACAQALARLRFPAAVAELARAARAEREAVVHIEIVHALGAHGSAAREELRVIAEGDATPAIRDLARGYLEELP
jgi:HEAT repeat protein